MSRARYEEPTPTPDGDSSDPDLRDERRRKTRRRGGLAADGLTGGMKRVGILGGTGGLGAIVGVFLTLGQLHPLSPFTARDERQDNAQMAEANAGRIAAHEALDWHEGADDRLDVLEVRQSVIEARLDRSLQEVKQELSALRAELREELRALRR